MPPAGCWQQMSFRREQIESLLKQAGEAPPNNHEPQTGSRVTAGRRQGENSSSLQLYFAALPLQNNRILQAEQVRRLPGPML